MNEENYQVSLDIFNGDFVISPMSDGGKTTRVPRWQVSVIMSEIKTGKISLWNMDFEDNQEKTV